MARYTAVLDACVLVPIALADTLLRVAERGLGESRSAVIRRGVHQLAEAVSRAQVGAAIADSYKRRPALVVSRDEVIPVLYNIVVAPVTSTVRDIPTCIPVGPDEGIAHHSVATFENLVAVPKSVLTTRLGALGIAGRRRICDALAAMANC